MTFQYQPQVHLKKPRHQLSLLITAHLFCISQSLIKSTNLAGKHFN